jgi:hypothetical protein
MNPKSEAHLGPWLTWSLALHVVLLFAWWVIAVGHSSWSIALSTSKIETDQPTLNPNDTIIPTTTDGGTTLAHIVSNPLEEAIKDLPPAQHDAILRQVANVLDRLAQDSTPSELAAVTPITANAWKDGVLVSQIVQVVLTHANQQVAGALSTGLSAAPQTGAINTNGPVSTGKDHTETTHFGVGLTPTDLAISAPSDQTIGRADASSPQRTSSIMNQGGKFNRHDKIQSGSSREVTQGQQNPSTKGAKPQSGKTTTSNIRGPNGSSIPEFSGNSQESTEALRDREKRAGGLSVKNQGGVQTTESYRKLVSQVAQRGHQAGLSWINPSIILPVVDPVVKSRLTPTHVIGGSDFIELPIAKKSPYTQDFPSLAFQAIPYLPMGFTLDGSTKKWDGIPRLAMRPEWGTDASEQVVQVGWRRDGLYVRCEVNDPDRLIRHAQATRFWEGDNIEIWFDGQNLKRPYRSRTTGQHFWIWPEGAADNVDQIGGEARIEHRGGGVEAFPFTKDRFMRAAMRTNAGWMVEFRLDKSVLINATLEPGRIIGLNVYLNTLSGTNWYWSAGKKSNTWYQPDTWGDVLLAGSDATLERAEVRERGKFPPLVAGQPVRLRVTDADMNLDPTQPDRVEVILQTDHGRNQRAVLSETGNSTGVFIGSIATTPALDEDPPGLLGLNPGEQIKVTYRDQVRSDGAKGTEVAVILRVGSAVLMGDIDRP